MSGHSKWANIKHKIGKADAAFGKIATKIARVITIAVRMGGADPTGNMKLKLALSKATYVYADVEKTFGGEVDTNWQWNLGVRYSF